MFIFGDALAPAAKWLAREVKATRTLVTHNGKFDLHHLRATFGLRVGYPVHDTMIESFIIDNRGAGAVTGGFDSHHLKDLATVYVDEDAHDPEKEMLSAIRRRAGVGAHKGDWPVLLGTEDEHLVTTYGGLDPWYTLQLHLQFIERIRYWPQPEGDYPSLMSLYETERWLLLALLDMEERGIMVNRDFLEKWRDELAIKLTKYEKRLRKLAGCDINWNSTPQLRELLYEKMGLESGSVTEAGELSTDEATMKTLAHPIGQAILDYREAFKQHGSYAVSLLDAIQADGAIHTTFRQTGARTGRMSCADPNMQQQARESGVRKAYFPRKGLVFRFADYSQVEMRFAGHFANEPMLVNGFNTDPEFDTHAATAIKMFGVAVPTSRQRKYAKIINFTTLFGGGHRQVTSKLVELMTYAEAVEGLREFKVIPKAGESVHAALAAMILKRHRERLPAMQRITKERAEIAEARGFTINAFGRHRFLTDGRWYSTFNSEVQGSAVDMAKRGLVALYRELQLNTGEIALLLQIHDEAVYESEGNPRTDRRVLELLSDTTRFRVPIIADISGSAVNWQDKEKIKL
jgi:DNA polymerase-1